MASTNVEDAKQDFVRGHRDGLQGNDPRAGATSAYWSGYSKGETERERQAARAVAVMAGIQ